MTVENNTPEKISEMPTSSLNINFDFKGSQYSLALEDSEHLMLSMTCFNVNFDVNPDKKAVLQKVFGSLVTFEKK